MAAAMNTVEGRQLLMARQRAKSKLFSNNRHSLHSATAFTVGCFQWRTSFVVD